MSSSFFGLTIAYSGLNAAQACINTTANNISNINTTGYSKQVTNISAASALRCYQKYGCVSTGVQVDSVTQLRNTYYDLKYWNNNCRVGYYSAKQTYLSQIENYLTDGTSSTTSSGFTTIFTKLFNAMDSLSTNAGDSSYRTTFVSYAQELCTYFNSLSTSLQEIQSTINDEVKTTVDQINTLAKKIATLNYQINLIETNGDSTANELRDERALLIDELSELVSVETSEVQITNSNYEDQYLGGTVFTVTINGQTLVDGTEYNTLSCVAREEKYNQSDVDGLYDIVWTSTGSSFNATGSSASGTLKGLLEIRDGNNGENLTGTVSSVTGSSITITSPSITDVTKMNMPSSGTITVNSTTYTYSSFTCEYDEDGNITSYTFNLEETLDADTQSKLRGRTLEVGESVDFKGIPYYLNQMNEFLRSFCSAFNSLYTTGVDYNGDAVSSLFVSTGFDDTEYDMSDYCSGSTANSYYLLTAANISVDSAVLKDATLLACATDITEGVDAHDLIDQLLLLQDDTTIYRGGSASAFLECLYTDITVDVLECNTFYETYSSIGTTIDNQRTSVSGVDEDEEALDLIKYQNAYNLASKCITVLQEMYEQLILETGV